MTTTHPPPRNRPDVDAPEPDETSTDADAQQLLAVYLQDHHAAAGAGLALVRRCHQNNDGTEFERELGDLVANIASDADRLSDAMATLGVEPSRIKVVASQAGEVVAVSSRTAACSTTHRRAGSSNSKGLIAGITAKRQLWRSLHAAEQDAFSRSELETLSARADEQIAVVDALHGLAARIAFGPTSR
jgi:hypothetical protein